MSIYHYTDISIEKAIYKYLYGTFDPISDLDNHGDRIREGVSQGDTISVGMQGFMVDGPGRYITPSNFSLIAAFFDHTIPLNDNVYTLSTLLSQNGYQNRNTWEEIRTYPVDIYSDDYDTRSFVWGTTTYAIKDAVFVVENGIRKIESIEIVPTQENFDFVGGDGTPFINLVLSGIIDPMKIGLKFFIDFVGEGTVFQDYQVANYEYDHHIFDSISSLESVWKAKLALWEGSGFILDTIADPLRGFIEDGRNVMYGNRDESVTLDAHSPINNIGPDLMPVVLVGGAKNDTLIGSAWDDLLFGGSGDDVIYAGRPSADNTEMNDEYADVVFGGAGNDVVYIGGGSDIVSLGDGDDVLHIYNEDRFGGQAIIWGGEGADSYYFEHGARVLSINVEDMSDELLLNLSVDAFFESINSNYREYPFNYIIINIDADDKIFYEGREITGNYSIDSTSEQVTEQVNLFEFDTKDENGIEEWKLTFAGVANASLTNYFYAVASREKENFTFIESDLGSGLEFSTSTEEGRQFQFLGLTDTSGPIRFIGNELKWTYEALIKMYTPDMVSLWSEQIIENMGIFIKKYQNPLEFSENASPQIQFDERESSNYLKPDDWGKLPTVTYDLNDFQIKTENGSDDDDKFEGTKKAQRFKGKNGEDTVDYSGSPEAVFVNLLAGTGTGGTATGDTYSSIENVIGSNFDDRIDGDSQDNKLWGGKGNDYLAGGLGNDTIDGGEGTDTVEIVGAQADYVVTFGVGKTVLLTSSTSIIKIRDVEQFAFQNAFLSFENFVLSASNVAGSSASDILNGTVGSDTISALQGDDTIIGGLGDDILFGGGGSDTYVYSAGDGNDIINDQSTNVADVDTLKFTDLNIDDLTFERDEAHLNITVNSTGEIIIISNQFESDEWGVESIQFGNGIIWEQADLLAHLEASQVPVLNIIEGTSASDVIVSTTGDDLLKGKADNDTYVYTFGNAHDVIEDGLGDGDADKLTLSGISLSDVVLEREGDDLIIIVPESTSGAGNGGSVTVKNTLRDDDSGIELFEFDDWTYTTADMRWFVLSQLETDGDDVIEGFSATADYLTGGSGDDTFVFSGDFGWDTISDFTAGAGTDDVIEFRGGTFSSFEDVLMNAYQLNADTIITVTNDIGITLANVNLSDLLKDDFRFAA